VHELIHVANEALYVPAGHGICVVALHVFPDRHEVHDSIHVADEALNVPYAQGVCVAALHVFPG
jgi:hypothetical protein